ncbi:right-handed parallel beta-helix repeat-containing protein [Candidatus Nomurabacteria bacterium]|nr:right-handed parallel beta-helix repeat-containing protein [Candidatus Nomurabacteria bacterium]
MKFFSVYKTFTALFIASTILAFFFILVPNTFAATITVDSTTGEAALDTECNFAEAIDSVNNGSDRGDCVAGTTDPYGTNDTIAFNIAGGGVQTIVFNAGIPGIVRPVVIDGLTQPDDGASGPASCGTTSNLSDRNLLVNLDFNNAGNLDLGSGSEGSSIQGVAIYGSSQSGIGIHNAGNTTISCNHIGLDVVGTSLPVNRNYYSGITGSYGSATPLQNVTIGGPTVGDGNIITGNLCAGVEMYEQKIVNMTLENNRVGTDISGLATLGNYEEGISFGSGNYIGGESQNIVIRSNIVAGNQAADYPNPTNCSQTGGGSEIDIQGYDNGILVLNQDLVIENNYVGVGSDGVTPLPSVISSVTGVFVREILGGNISNNLISNNSQQGLNIYNSQTIDITNNRIGTDATGMTLASNGFGGLMIIHGSDATITNNTIVDDNFASLVVLGEFGGAFGQSSDITIQNNTIGVASDGLTPLGNPMVSVQFLGTNNVLFGGTNPAQYNRVQSGTLAGVLLNDIQGLPWNIDNITILGNSMFNNNGMAIDFAIDTNTQSLGQAGLMDGPEENLGPNVNDIGDIDTGANDYLNYPVIYNASTDINGTPLDPFDDITTIDFYLDIGNDSISRDVRVEFFSNGNTGLGDTIPATLHGEGKDFIIACDITHSGSGVQTYNTTTEGCDLTVSSGEIISATATIIDNPLALDDLTKYGSTSEFGNTVVVESFGPDFGDAPDTYFTTATNNGPYHLIDGVTYLGSCVDADNGTLTNRTATADNATSESKSVGCAPGQDDEDGVTFPTTLDWGSIDNEITIEASVNGILNAWIDLDRNGVFDPTDQIVDNYTLNAGFNTIMFDIPAGSGYEPTYARFRFSTEDIQQLNKTQGESLTGEVEDYRIFFGIPPVTSSGGGSVNYACTDPEATNYDDSSFVRHKQSLCEYEYNAEIANNLNNGATQEGNVSADNNTCPIFTQHMKKGDRDGYTGQSKQESGISSTITEVKLLQQTLLEQGFNPGTIDGWYGIKTAQAVSQWQTKHYTQVLTPWNLTHATGFFYQSSERWMNELLGCDDVVTLDNGVTLTERYTG